MQIYAITSTLEFLESVEFDRTKKKRTRLYFYSYTHASLLNANNELERLFLFLELQFWRSKVRVEDTFCGDKTHTTMLYDHPF